MNFKYYKPNEVKGMSAKPAFARIDKIWRLTFSSKARDMGLKKGVFVRIATNSDNKTDKSIYLINCNEDDKMGFKIGSNNSMPAKYRSLWKEKGFEVGQKFSIENHFNYFKLQKVKEI